jgi:hypothetical protein
MTSSNLWSDGNALAGPLQGVLSVDLRGLTYLQLPAPEET